jgi:parafibromin
VAELKAKRQKTRGDTDVLTSAVYSAQASVKEILARERPYLDRKTVLQAPKKNFSKLLDRLVEIKNGGKAKAASAAAQSSSSRPAAAAGASRGASHAAPSYTSSRPAKTGYDRFEQSEERVMKASGIELEMNINTRGTFDDSAFGTSAKPNIFSAANSAAASKKRSYDQMAANEPTDMDMDIDDDYSRPAAPSAPAPAPAAASKKHSQSAEPPKKKRKYPDASLDPIILVPNANDAKAMLHASNAVKFLQDGEYVDDRSSRTRQFNVERNKFDGNGKVSYLVSDGSRMHAKDWDRVVCVVVNGTEWQFKSFPSELQTPANLFSRVKGYFLRYEDDPAPATVRSWNVAQLTISKPRRHLDQAASKRFWEELEQFIHTTRPEIKH